jgi:hypothetical protein
MKLVKTIMLLGGLCVLSACEPRELDPDAVFINKSNIDICIYLLPVSSSIYDCNPLGIQNKVPDYWVKHNDTEVIKDNGSKLGGFRSRVHANGRTVILQVFNDSIEKIYFYTPCDTFRKYVPILYCYQFTIEELEKKNWTIVYPPEED